MTTRRQPRLLHCTSEPLHFFGRAAELALLDAALSERGPSVVALVGPGGQGKTAIVRHWLERFTGAGSVSDGRSPPPSLMLPALAGVFFWSFYRGKDVDLCLREWLAYAEGLSGPPDVSAAWCVDRLLGVLRRERWAVALDGAEVVQYEDGPWRGRFVHPDLGRLLEELGSEPMPGLVALTTRFDLPTLARRPYVRELTLDRLDVVSARELLVSLGVRGDESQLDAATETAGRHAKAVELLGTYLVRFRDGDVTRVPTFEGPPADEEAGVERALALWRHDLRETDKDVLALATSFREPPPEPLLLDYLASPAVADLLAKRWGRTYPPPGRDGLVRLVDGLVRWRLLERVHAGGGLVIDAHPLVRRGFEHGSEQGAAARAGFLRGRPDRRRPNSLEEARDAVELFHAFCDAGLWAEADAAFVALENPKHRLLAPGLEQDLLLRFFPERDWRRPPSWPGFGRWRSLAICLEMLGRYEEALEAYRPTDAALRGDSLLALGRLKPMLDAPSMAAPWQTLWGAYRAHALCLAGRVEEAVALARSLVPVDVYEWVHVFECLLRAGRLDAIDLRSVLARGEGEHRWGDLARRRMRADWLRVRGEGGEMGAEYRLLIDEYGRAGLAYERALTGLSEVAWLAGAGRRGEALDRLSQTWGLIEQSGLAGLRVDALAWLAELGDPRGERLGEERERLGIRGPMRR